MQRSGEPRGAWEESGKPLSSLSRPVCEGLHRRNFRGGGGGILLRLERERNIFLGSLVLKIVAEIAQQLIFLVCLFRNVCG